MSVYSKLISIQRELVAPKGQYNGFGKYNYRSCEDILKALKPLCDKYDCLCYISNDLECIGDRNYVKATVTFHDLETNESIVCTAHAREEETKKGMDGSQITGASSSYARKYALAGMFCIDNEQDSDATNVGEPKKVSTTQAKTIENLIEKNGRDKEKLLKYFGVNSLEELNTSQYAEIIKILNG